MSVTKAFPICCLNLGSKQSTKSLPIYFSKIGRNDTANIYSHISGVANGLGSTGRATATMFHVVFTKLNATGAATSSIVSMWHEELMLPCKVTFSDRANLQQILQAFSRNAHVYNFTTNTQVHVNYKKTTTYVSKPTHKNQHIIRLPVSSYVTSKQLNQTCKLRNLTLMQCHQAGSAAHRCPILPCDHS